MYKTFVCFLLFFAYTTLIAEEDYSLYTASKTLESHAFGDDHIPLANLEGEPSAIIASHVNAITGDFCDFQVDLISPGTHPLTIQRSFNGNTRRSGNLCNGWNLNHATRIKVKQKESHSGNTEKFYIYLEEGLGSKICFKKSVKLPKIKDSYFWQSPSFELFSLRQHLTCPEGNIPMEEHALDQGATNTSSGYLSGKTNLKNIELYKTSNGTYEVRTGSGVIKKFDYDNYISYEKRPDGQALRYSYGLGYVTNRLKVVHENFYGVCRNSLDFTPISKQEFKTFPHQEVVTWDNRKVCYHFNRDFLLRRVERSDGPRESYQYTSGDKVKGKYVSAKQRPNKRYVAMSYYTHGKNFVNGKSVKADKYSINKVREILQPSGCDATPIVTHSFLYDQQYQHYKTDVFDAYGYMTRYNYDHCDRLTSILKFDKSEQLISKEKMYWALNRSSEKTNLVARSLESSSEGLFFARTYMYDSYGNVLENNLYGNLTGKNTTTPVLNHHGKLENSGCECYTKKYSYVGDNLLECESDDKHSIYYSYHPNTSLLASKLKGFDNKYYNREFYEYDGDAALIKMIIDDGSTVVKDDLSGVSERHIVYISNTCSFPFGLPETVDEKYLDFETQEEKLSRRIINKYTPSGKISSQEHYDSQGELAYTLLWEYDHMGNVTQHVDAIGRVIVKRYDANCNCIYEKGPRQDCYKEYSYDFMNRLIKEEEFHDDGIRLAVAHQYDYKGNRIATIDANGNTTQYEYDAFGRITKTTLAEVADENGLLHRPFKAKSYDLMGCVTKETDAKGAETVASYTVRGQLVHMTYPDGTSEKNVYYTNGTLKEAYAKNGSYTHYTYDVAGRPTCVETYSTQGELLKTVSSIYSGFHLLEEIDPMGISTRYTYYGNGKLKSRQKGDSLTFYDYDTLGRLVKTTDHCGEKASVVNIRCYDLLNRIVEERIEDLSGTVFTRITKQYDVSGNVCATETLRNGVQCVTTSLYDSHGTPSIAIDALGNKTVTVCDYNYRNEYRQNVPHIEVTDPLGNITAITQDTCGRIVSQIRKDAFGTITQQIETFYDSNGNICRILDTIFSNGKKEKVLATVMTYDIANRLIDTYEAVGMPEQKHTSITYNAIGLKEDLIKADGIRITHTYDDLGRLQTMSSSEGSIDYAYEYDCNGNAVVITDGINRKITYRTYDQNGQLIREQLANGYTLNYTYDAMGRPTSITFPDKTGVAYTYKSCFMESVERLDDQSNVIYKHVYESYDMAGNATEIRLIDKAGTLTCKYDLAGRPVLVENEQWAESIDSYDKCGNMLNRTLKEGTNETCCAYEYENLYQLKSESGLVQHTYTYDSHYNRTSKDKNAYDLNGLNQVLDDGTTRYTYDPNGNLICEESHQKRILYSYDALDRLISFDDGTNCAHYYYDENHRRLQKEVCSSEGESSTFYLYQGQNEVGTVDNTGKIIQLRLLGNSKGAEVGASVAIEIDNHVYAPIHDLSGNIACLLDAKTGRLAETYRYSAYGEELFDSAISPWRFSSKRTDEESGLVYFGRRYYHTELGRWIAPDPIGREGGVNYYAYVLNNPLTHFDAYGLFADSFFESIAEHLVSFVCNPIAKTGECLEFLTFHLMPFPLIRDGLFWTAHCMQGKDPFAYEWESSKQHAYCYHYEGVNGPAPEGTVITTLNGMCTTKEEMRERCSHISENHGGVDVYGIYNPTHGLVLDLCEVVLQKFGFPTNAQRSAQKSMEKLIERFYHPDKGLSIITHAHSQGCETVDNLSLSVKQMMQVHAYGPAKILQRNQYLFARNYLSPIDLVPYIADPLGMIRGMCDGSITFVRPEGNFFLNHCMAEIPYQKVLDKVGSDFKLKRLQNK